MLSEASTSRLVLNCTVVDHRLDPSSTQHGAYVDDEGVFHYQHIDTASSSTTTLLRFQLQYRAEDGLAYEPVNTPWLFEFVPGAPGDLLLVQQGSCRILYASLPKQGVNSSDVFLFGSHTGMGPRVWDCTASNHMA